MLRECLAGTGLLRQIVHRDVDGARQGAQCCYRALFPARFDLGDGDAVDPGPFGQCGLGQLQARCARDAGGQRGKGRCRLTSRVITVEFD